MQLVIAAVAWSGDFGRPTLFNVAIAALNFHFIGSESPFKLQQHRLIEF
jgi:hypothetical protein